MDQEVQEVSISGVTPDDAVIVITAVGQDTSPRCNNMKVVDTGESVIRPNALNLGSSTVDLRRTIVPGQLSPFRYTVYFTATTEAGSCTGQVSVCSAPEGLNCDYYYGYDASATEYCEPYYPYAVYD